MLPMAIMANKAENEFLEVWNGSPKINHAENVQQTTWGNINAKDDNDNTLLIGLDHYNMSAGLHWRDIEVKNLSELCNNSTGVRKFFRVGVDFRDVSDTIANGGLLKVNCYAYQEMLDAPTNCSKYVLLQESFRDFYDASCKLIGVAMVTDLVSGLYGKKNTGFGHKQIKVVFLSLSRSGIDLGRFALNDNVEEIDVILNEYVNGLRKSKVYAYVNNVYPWCVPEVKISDNFKLSDSEPAPISPSDTTKSTKLSSQIKDEKEPSGLAGILEKKESRKHVTHYIPPLMNLVQEDGTINKQDWRTMEYKNIESLTDWSSSTYLIVDIRLADLYVVMHYDGILTPDEYLYDKIDQVFNNDYESVYLIFRKVVPGGKKRKSKPVVGIAKVMEKCTDWKLKVIFLCASCPLYVGSPWSEEEMFTSGQEITFKEDIRILLDEYKMSLRHKKAKPLFDDLYPWGGSSPGTLPEVKNASSQSTAQKGFHALLPTDAKAPQMEFSCNTKCQTMTSTHFTEAQPEKQSTTENTCKSVVSFKIKSHPKQLKEQSPNCFSKKTQNKQKQSTILNDSGDVRNKPPQRSDSAKKLFKPEASPIIDRTSEVNVLNAVPPSQPSAGHDVQTPPKSTTRTSPKNMMETLPRFANRQSVSKSSPRRSSSSSSNPQSPTSASTAVADIRNDLSHADQQGIQPSFLSSKHLPPLRGLYEHNKALTTRTWHEIELHNLEQTIEHSTNRMEVYLCDTTTLSIQQSFLDSMLEISHKNMENLASNSRCKRYFVLRVAVPNTSKQSSIGIASVQTTNGITKSKRNDRFFVQVSYLCLSIPGLKELSGRNHYDGMEVYPNVANSFIQQYKFRLSQMKVTPLFPKVFPWCPTPPHQKGTSSSSSASSSSSRNLSSTSIGYVDCIVPISPAPDEVFDEIPSPSRSTVVVVDFDDERLAEERSFDSYFREQGDVKSVGITFEDIRKQMDVCHIRESAGSYQIKHTPYITQPLPQPKSSRRKEMVEKHWQEKALEFTQKLMSPPVHKSTKSRQYKKNHLTVNPPSPAPGSVKGRGRGRGFWLMQQAGQSGGDQRPGFLM